MASAFVALLTFEPLSDTIPQPEEFAGMLYCDMTRRIAAADWDKLLWLFAQAPPRRFVILIGSVQGLLRRGQFMISPESKVLYERYNTDATVQAEYDQLYDVEQAMQHAAVTTMH